MLCVVWCGFTDLLLYLFLLVLLGVTILEVQCCAALTNLWLALLAVGLPPMVSLLVRVLGGRGVPQRFCRTALGGPKNPLGTLGSTAPCLRERLQPMDRSKK